MAETVALVAGGIDHGESNRIIHLLTPHGRLDVFAPGARQSRRRFAGVFQPLQTIEVSVHRPERRAERLPTATAARVLEARLPLRRSLECIGLATYAVELGRRVAPEGEATDVFVRVRELLDHLLDNEASRAARRAFELRLVAAMGYGPAVAACAVCGSGAPAFVDFELGGGLCLEHRGSGDRVGPGTRAWMERVVDADFNPLGGHVDEDADRAARTLARPLDRFFGRLLDGPLKSAAFVAQLAL